MGIFDKITGAFKKKEEVRVIEEPRRVVPEPIAQVPEEEQPGNLYLKARKWREQKAMQEPLVKRSTYKKKYY